MSNWIEELKENIGSEFGKKPAIVTLATLRSSAVPDARSVVVRNLFDDGRMLITSDARSEKNRQLKLNASATVVFWLPTLRKQFRVDGKMTVLTDADPLRSQTWQGSSDSARALFFWPPAGEPRVNGNFPKSIGLELPIPASFEVLQLSPSHADVLDLNPHPHLRTRWSLESNVWNRLTVNP